MAADPDSSLGEAERARRAILTTWEISLDGARFEPACWRIQAWEACTVVKTSPRLTDTGRQFAAMADSAAAWRTEPVVPAEVAATARAAALVLSARGPRPHAPRGYRTRPPLPRPGR
ncbi:hypothetical protein QFZ43_008200 [Streptomyces afghaniensis]|nr:hypothetical protein [Streptomyces afghaniensis]